MSWILPESGSFQIPKDEQQRAVIIEIIDLGTQLNTLYPDTSTGKPKEENLSCMAC
jgi:hypothetical protein